jgi:transposase
MWVEASASNILKGCDIMIYLGIDIAKITHFAIVMNDNGEELVPVFSFNNDIKGFQLLLSKLEPFDKSDIVVGLESTAHYANNLVYFLFDHKYNIAVINPIQTAALKKTNIRKTYTDKTSTRTIVKSLILNGYRLFSQQDLLSLRLKNLCRFRGKIKKSKARLKIQLLTYIDLSFPELQFFFKSGLHIKTCYSILMKHSDPDEIAALHLTYLGNLLSKSSRGHFGREEAIALKSLAKSSVGSGSATVTIQITQSISQIELLEKQIKELEEIIISIMIKIDSVIMSIPGIGYLNGAMILGEIGSISRFNHPSKLLAFAGLDPVVKQSGKFKAKEVRMSKRGSKMLRYALINAAWNVSLNNKTFNDYFKLKRSQCNHHFAALGHVAHKLVRVIYKMLKDNVAFNLD